MNRKQIALALGIMCFILTLTIVLQVRTTSNSNKVVSQTFTSNDLRDQVLKWKERYDTAYSELQDSEKKLDQVRQTASENTDGSAEKEEEIKKNNILIGLTDVSGEGVIVTLKDNPNVIRVFIYSDEDAKIKRAIKHYNLNEKNAKKEIEKIDKERARHYKYYTNQEWGNLNNYDIALNSDYLGVEKTAQIIQEMIFSKTK